MLNISKNKIHSRNFNYNGFFIKVECNKLAPIQWLLEFLSPTFETSNKTSKKDCKVILFFNEREYNLYKKLTKKKVHKTIDAFALDTGMIRLPAWKLNTNELIIFEEQTKVFYNLIPINNCVRIIAKFDSISARKALMRVVREFAMNHTHRLGNLIVHGAALSLRNKGLVIAGPKRAGKTTLLMRILTNKFANFLANDRVAVSLDNSKPTIKGIPTIINISDKTLDIFSELKEKLISRNFVYHLSTNEAKFAKLKSIRPDRLGNVSISPRQFCHLLEVNHAAEANLSALLFPQIINALRGKNELKEITPEKAAEKLMSSLFRSGSKKLASSAFNLGPNTKTLDKKKLKNRCLDLTSRVLCIECFIGLDSLKNDYTFTKFVERLLN